MPGNPTLEKAMQSNETLVEDFKAVKEQLTASILEGQKAGGCDSTPLADGMFILGGAEAGAGIGFAATKHPAGVAAGAALGAGVAGSMISERDKVCAAQAAEAARPAAPVPCSLAKAMAKPSSPPVSVGISASRHHVRVGFYFGQSSGNRIPGRNRHGI